MEDNHMWIKAFEIYMRRLNLFKLQFNVSMIQINCSQSISVYSILREICYHKMLYYIVYTLINEYTIYYVYS